MKFSQGFAPVSRPDARALILGSMPGVASLEASEYYAFKRNVFWRVMGELYAAGPELDYHLRLQVLTSHHIALWDVIQACHRPGSLDSAITAQGMLTNDFDAFFRQHTKIHKIYFNGQTAAKLFRKKVLPGLQGNYEYITLPSTSPAHAARSYADKLKAWAVIESP